MNPHPSLFVAVSLVILVFAIIAAYRLGYSDANREMRDRQEDAAAAICPTCSAFESPARRLSVAHARISGVEYFGRHYAQTEDDVVDDANQILRLAMRHIDRLDRRLAGR